MVLTKKIAIKPVTDESLVLDDIQTLLPTTEILAIANVLPAEVDAPDWGTREPSWRAKSEYPLVAKAKAALARVGIDLEREEAARFDRFLDGRFPRETFPDFRDMVDGPDLLGMVARREGWRTAPRSKLANYNFIARTRRTLRGVAEILAQVAAKSGAERPALRFCEHCDSVFIARRKDKVWCKDGCGSVIRMRRKRDKYRQYEDARKKKQKGARR